jgi:hypothetical protein
MGWFKLKWLSSEEREILRAGKEKKLAPEPVALPETKLPREDENLFLAIADRPYKNLFYSNTNLTVVFQDGTMVSKSGVGQTLFNQVRDAKTQSEIEGLMIEVVVEPKPVYQKQEFETQEERDLVSDNLDVLIGNENFEIKGTDVFLKGVNLAMPASVIGSFIEILEKLDALGDLHEPDDEAEDELIDQYNALKMFWLKLALNTLPQSREDLLTFVRKNDVRITPNGNLVLYRRIVTKNGTDTKLVSFVSQQYYRLKKENQDTRHFAVARVGEDYGLVDLRDYVGIGPEPFINLQVAYLELPTYDTNRFTAWHGKGVDIRIGGIYKIPDTGINLDNGLCAAGGLHAAAVDYDYSGFGDLPVVVLVNPSKAITVPVNETGKLRTIEMFVACVNDKAHGQHFDDGALSAFDNEYHDLSLGELEEAAKSKSFEKLSVLDTVPAVSLVDLNVIKEMLKKRIVTI